jgi:hypothetical protein
MKKILVISALFLACYSCNNGNKNNNTGDTATTTPSIDTAKGIHEGALNSNDTAAMRAVNPGTDTSK